MNGDDTPAADLLDRLSAEELTDRLREREAECDALRTLLRAAKQRDRGRAKAAPVTAERGAAA